MYTAESYAIDLADLNVPANSYSYTLTPEANAAGPFIHSQTVTTKGTYQFKVRNKTPAGGCLQLLAQATVYGVTSPESNKTIARLHCRLWHPTCTRHRLLQLCPSK